MYYVIVMDSFEYKNICFIPNFEVDDLDEDSLYILSEPHIEKIHGYTAKKFNLQDDDMIFFMKKLHSYHEVNIYKYIDGKGIAPRYIGLSEIGNSKYLILEKMTPLDYHEVKQNID